MDWVQVDIDSGRVILCKRRQGLGAVDRIVGEASTVDEQGEAALNHRLCRDWVSDSIPNICQGIVRIVRRRG